MAKKKKDRKKKDEPEALEIDLDIEVVDFDGEPLRHAADRTQVELCKDCSEKMQEVMGEPMTIRSICVEVLNAIPVDKDGRPKVVDEMKRFRRVELARQIYVRGGTMRISSDDITLLKQLIAERKQYAPMVIYRTFPVLDPNATAKVTKEFSAEDETDAPAPTEPKGPPA